MYLGGPVAPNCTINKIKSSPGPTARTRILLHPSTQIAESSTIYVHPQTSQSSPCTPKSPTHPQTPLRQKSHIPCSNATTNHHFQQQNRTVATRFPRFLYHRHTITRHPIPSRHDPFPCLKPAKNTHSEKTDN